VEISLGAERRLLCSHGSPRSYDDVIVATTPDAELAGMMASHDAAIIAGGHTHIRMLRAYQGREFVNPGSVGLAYRFFPDGSVHVPPWAEFALLSRTDAGAVSVDFRRVPYDRDATVCAMAEREMPHAAWWATGLALTCGRMSMWAVVNRQVRGPSGVCGPVQYDVRYRDQRRRERCTPENQI